MRDIGDIFWTVVRHIGGLRWTVVRDINGLMWGNERYGLPTVG